MVLGVGLTTVLHHRPESNGLSLSNRFKSQTGVMYQAEVFFMKSCIQPRLSRCAGGSQDLVNGRIVPTVPMYGWQGGLVPLRCSQQYREEAG
jgi:hypothetical protein